MIFAIGNLDAIVVLLYFAAVLGIGVVLSRKQASTEEYFLGNRKMNWLIVGISIQATLLSTISYLSVPGEQIKNGMGYLAAWLGVIPSILVVNYLLLPVLLRLRITTIYEYLERRFDLRVRMLAVTMFLLVRLALMGLVIYTASYALEIITGWPFYAIIIGVGIIGTLYTWMGGMRAVIWTDVIQWAVLFGGGIFCVLYVAVNTSSGPLDWWREIAQAHHTRAPLFSLDPRVRITILGIIISLFFSKICVHGADQVAIQRYLATPSAAAARRSYLSYIVSSLAVTGMMVLVGLALSHVSQFDSGMTDWSGPRDADQIFPWFIAHQLPPGVRGLVIAGLLAAAMSSIDSGINSIAAVVTVDIYQRFFAHKDHSQPAVWFAKLVTLIAGVVTIGVAFLMGLIPGNLYEVMNKSTGALTATLGVIVLPAILLPRCGSTSVIAGAAVSLICGWLITFSKEIFGMETGISFMWIAPGGCTAGLLVAWGLSFTSTKPD